MRHNIADEQRYKFRKIDVHRKYILRLDCVQQYGARLGIWSDLRRQAWLYSLSISQLYRHWESVRILRYVELISLAADDEKERHAAQRSVEESFNEPSLNLRRVSGPRTAVDRAAAPTLHVHTVCCCVRAIRKRSRFLPSGSRAQPFRSRRQRNARHSVAQRLKQAHTQSSPPKQSTLYSRRHCATDLGPNGQRVCFGALATRAPAKLRP